MRVTVIFPKAPSYYGKSLDTQRIYSALFKKYLGLLKDAGCTVEYFLEDKLAMDFVRPFGFTSERILTCVSPSDIMFFSKYKDLVDLEPYVYVEYEDAISCCGDYEKKIVVPITLIKEDREQYIQKRIEAFRKRMRCAIDDYIKKSKAVIMFRLDNGMDRSMAVRETIAEGDGRICVEVNLSTNFALVYYGGVYLTEDNLPAILSI